MLTIVTPAETQDLVTLAAVKTAFGISGTTEDVALAIFIAQASTMIATHCGRVFRQETVTETFRPTGRQPHALLLSRFPVKEISSVTEADEPVDAAGYDLDPESGLLERICGDRAAHWNGAAVVAYVGGYDDDDLPVPADLQGACIALVDHLKRRAATDPMLRSTEVDGIGAMSFQIPTTGIPDFIISLIDPYRSRSIG